ncbi:MAG TPA: IS1595 family transposase [Candidatus Aquilonibacter sp.]|nr:IS1595 family transposase [Candidatus Aquilonibacter sp.]
METNELNLTALAKHFSSEEAAREFLEKLRWPDGPVCPRCGVVDKIYKLQGKSTRPGLYKCGGCRKPFTVTVGTIFEDSHIPLSKWLLAYHLLCASKKGMSAHQLHRMLGVTYRSAWFMAHRIRYTMTQEPLSSKLTGVVEIDETYVGGKRRHHQPMQVKPGVRGQDRIGPFDGKATAQVYKCSILFAEDRRMQNRQLQLGLPGLKIMAPRAKSNTLFDQPHVVQDATVTVARRE